jgi:hypothetical protein
MALSVRMLLSIKGRRDPADLPVEQPTMFELVDRFSPSLAQQISWPRFSEEQIIAVLRVVRFRPWAPNHCSPPFADVQGSTLNH